MSGNDLIVTRWNALFMGRVMRVSVGRGGIGNKCGEGDAITPRGVYRVESWLCRQDRISQKFKPIGFRDGWCDDADNPCYNQHIIRPFNASHEQLFRTDHLYDLIGVLNFNRNPVLSGAGSAIFLHIWRKPRFPTQGCVAFAYQDLLYIALNWKENSRVIIQ